MAKGPGRRIFNLKLQFTWSYIIGFLALLSLVVYLCRDDKAKMDEFFEEMTHLELEFSNAFIHSAYYFKNSASLGESAIAMVVTMLKTSVVDLNKYQVKVVGTNSTDRFVTKAKLTTEESPDSNCKYTTVLIQTNSVKALSKLEIETRDGLVVIPPIKPKKEAPKPVVFCIAPLYAAEQWQSLLMQLHVSKKFGAHLHVYLNTLVEYYYQLAMELNELEIITAQPWMNPMFSQVAEKFLEPNRNLEIGNPGAAYTDCLLQYKEAAQFVGFMQVEDLLFPVDANTYYEEFEREYEASNIINALYYPVMEQESVKVTSYDQQSLAQVLEHMTPSGQAKRGRIVVRPGRYNSTWTHFSTQADGQPVYVSPQDEEPVFMHRKDIKTNGVLHFKTLEPVLNGTEGGSIPMNPVSAEKKLLTEEQLKDIDADIKKTMELPSLQSIVKYLPTEDYYSKYLAICVSGQPSDHKHCVNVQGCALPNNYTVPCRHSDGLYHSARVTRPFTYHFVTEPYFTRNLGCY